MDRRHDTYLLTPGPLTTSDTVKDAMLFDKSPNAPDMVERVREIRDYLLELANGRDTHVCVPVQGSATYGIEAGFQTLCHRDRHKVLVLINGFYGLRLKELLKGMKMPYGVLDLPVSPPAGREDLERALDADPAISHVVLCHCDTGTGILNPLDELAEVCRERSIRLMVDAVASFGGFEIDAAALDLEAVYVSPNKCLQGFPGLAFAIVKRQSLEASAGNALTCALDLYAQWQFLEDRGWFRFTPPTTVILALSQAIAEHKAEGGLKPRQDRYRRNWRRLVDGLRQRGAHTFLPDRVAAPIIATFHDPAHPNYSFERFYELMEQRGVIVFPGRLTAAETFRIGCMGDIDEPDINFVLSAIDECMEEMGVDDLTPGENRRIVA